MQKMIIYAVAGVLVAGISQPVVASSTDDDTNVVARLKESVADNWGKLSAWCGRVTALRSEMDRLPDSALWGSDKKSQRELIHDKVMKIRDILLSTNAREIMKHVDGLDKRIADIDHDIHKESARDVFCSAKGENRDAPLKKLREKRLNLVREREDAVRNVLRELEALGLRLSGGAEQCLFMVDAYELVDAVVVAKSIGIVVENLRALMATGDPVLLRYLKQCQFQHHCAECSSLCCSIIATEELLSKIERVLRC